ncbi:MAG: hypothetical protein RSH78_03610 [Bacilli bacterium]
MQNDARRTALFLINGFGVDRKDIYDICNDNIIPNINKLAKENIYSTINNISTDYRNGYRMLSTSEIQLPGYQRLDEDIKNNFEENEKFKNISNRIIAENKKLHIFCYLDNDTTINHVKQIIKNLKIKNVTNIYVHIILKTIKGVTYKSIEKYISSLKMVSFNYPDVQIGVFFGSELIDNDTTQTKELYQMLITEVGERWPDFVRKIEILETKKEKPGKIKPFFIQGGFKIQDGDSLLFLNYEYVDYSILIDMFLNPKTYFSLSNLPKDLKIYSLFPLKSKIPTESIYDIKQSDNYLVKYMEQMNTKALVLTTQDRIPYINNYFNGLQNIKSDRLDFMILEDNLPIPNIITNPEYQLFIFDFDIGSVSNMEELKNELHRADTMLGKVAEQCKIYDYSLFFSSLYGIQKEWKRDMTQVYIIDYTSQLPLIISDRLIVKGKQYVNSGSTLNLLPSICKNMRKDLSYPSLISEKNNGLLSIFGIK